MFEVKDFQFDAFDVRLCDQNHNCPHGQGSVLRGGEGGRDEGFLQRRNIEKRYHMKGEEGIDGKVVGRPCEMDR